DAAASAALEAGPAGREGVENDLSRALRSAVPLLPPDPVLAELATAATRVGLARSFHNAAVRDTRGVRMRRIPRALRLAGHRELPQYFEIDDTKIAV
ncbi:MAG: putative hydrolase, partial [Frankiales bacterium]|nr:putative hydrolase [Frankiales bacterium]